MHFTEEVRGGGWNENDLLERRMIAKSIPLAKLSPARHL
jgi:hypothetical protein